MIGFVISLIFAISFLLLGIPLIFRKVKPNHFYGFRVSKYVFKSDDIWYEVNAKGGMHLIFMGIVLMIVASLALVYIDDNSLQGILLLITLLIGAMGIIISLIITYNLAHRLAKEKGLK